MAAKKLLVLARRDPNEAMRVAAGLTIHEHDVSLIFLKAPQMNSDASAQQVELLELTGIVPKTMIAELEDELELLNAEGLGVAIKTANHVISL